ncbi:glycine oxidase ThiO [Sphaerisporangium siamense]|uniref:Glycine oxidase n=1 Tax=Sphaerisporangium siamense TaxID=795645 RepID=A0A7W7DFM0_9ACTN|nr:FAD-dependent oxidoreductase [Sphaerisporangium siamense]MBB4706020.1 glycine oxidase [Sphaerisporangium siamense]GII88625.1 glycine oxidase ThiO [Sphaerisporangium siamense]
MPETCDVAIIGGGVIGCAAARALASRGRTVLIVDAADRLGSGASSAAMGGILTQTEPSCLGPLSAVIKHSRDLYLGWLDELTSVSGVDVPVLQGGDIQVALDETEMRRLEDEVLPRWTGSPFEVVRLTAAEAREREPMLSEAVIGGFLLPEELALDPMLLMESLTTALKAGDLPIRVRTGAAATRVASTPGGAEVRLRDGDRIAADAVVVAAGHHSPALLPSHRAHLFPIKGEAFDTRPPGAKGYPLRHHIFTEYRDGDFEAFPYLVPRHDGRVAMGVTYEPCVSDTTATAAAREQIMRGVAALMPEAATWPVVRHWAGLRPGSTDHMPIIGHVDDHARVLAATGHSGLGITLAPATAELVATLIAGHPTPETRPLLDICRPDREFVPPAT